MHVVTRTIKGKKYALCLDSSKHKIGLYFDTADSPDVRKFTRQEDAEKVARKLSGTVEPT